MLGICMSALTSGTAFAQMAASTQPAMGLAEQSDATKALFIKQDEIDQYIFTDHAKELADKGITVNYTGVADQYVEIGISPYTDANANYLYNIFGKDMVKVVAYDESVMYATTAVAEPSTAVSGTGQAEAGTGQAVAGTVTSAGAGTVTSAGVSGTGTTETGTVDAGTMTTTTVNDAGNAMTNPATAEVGAPDKAVPYSVETAPNASVSSDAAAAADGRVYKSGEVQSQTNSANQTADDQVMYATGNAAYPESADVQTVSAADHSKAVKSSVDETSSGISAPLMILVIAGVAALAGGTILITNKKKNTK